MLIDLTDLMTSEEAERSYPVLLETNVISFSGTEYPVTKKSEFQLTVFHDRDRRITVNGVTEVALEAPCDRCLTNVTVTIPVHIQDAFDLPEESASIDAEELIITEILLHWPEKILCREDCKGLCPVCGCDLNRQTCNCNRRSLDPRMAQFLDVFNESKEV